MSDTFTSALRLQQPTVGGDIDTWGGITNTDWALVDQAIAGIAIINTSTVTSGTLSLTALDGAPDQSRCTLYQFTGTAISGGIDVFIPQSTKLGYAQNTSGQQVALGAATPGRVAVIPANTLTPAPITLFVCDGTNVDAPPIIANVEFINNNVTVNGTLSAIELDGTNGVFANDLQVDGVLQVFGLGLFETNVEVAGSVISLGTVESTLAMGTTGSFAAGGPAYLLGGVTITDGATIDTLTVTGVAAFDNNITTGGALTVSGLFTASSTIYANGALVVAGPATHNGISTFNGVNTFNNSMSIDTGVYMGPAAAIKTAFTVDGNLVTDSALIVSNGATMGLPTSNPGGSGVLWRSGNTVMIT